MLTCIGEGIHVFDGEEMTPWPGTDGFNSDRLVASEDWLLGAFSDGRIQVVDAKGAALHDGLLPMVVSYGMPWDDLAVLVAEDGRVFGLDPYTGQVSWTLPVGAVTPRALSRQGEHLLVLEHDRVSTWELPTLGQRLFEGTRGLTSAAFDDEGRWLATANGAGQVTVWDLETHHEHLSTGLDTELAVVKWLDLSPLGDEVAFGSVARSYSYRHRFDGEREVLQDLAPVRRLAYFADGTLSMLTYAAEGPWKLLGQSGELRTEPLEGPCDDQEMDITRTVLVAACRSGSVWRLRKDGQAELVGGYPAVQAVAPGPGGELVVVAEEQRIWVVDGTGTPQTSFVHPYRAIDVAVSPDGSMLATASEDGMVRVFTREGVLLQELRGHTRRVPFVRFTADGESLWSASWDGRARQWGLGELDADPVALQQRIEQDWGLTLEDLQGS